MKRLLLIRIHGTVSKAVNKHIVPLFLLTAWQGLGRKNEP